MTTAILTAMKFMFRFCALEELLRLMEKPPGLIPVATLVQGIGQAAFSDSLLEWTSTVLRMLEAIMRIAECRIDLPQEQF
jgi:hypothetical protein